MTGKARWYPAGPFFKASHLYKRNGLVAIVEMEVLHLLATAL